MRERQDRIQDEALCVEKKLKEVQERLDKYKFLQLNMQ